MFLNFIILFDIENLLLNKKNILLIYFHTVNSYRILLLFRHVSLCLINAGVLNSQVYQRLIYVNIVTTYGKYISIYMLKFNYITIVVDKNIHVVYTWKIPLHTKSCPPKNFQPNQMHRSRADDRWRTDGIKYWSHEHFHLDI